MEDDSGDETTPSAVYSQSRSQSRDFESADSVLVIAPGSSVSGHCASDALKHVVVGAGVTVRPGAFVCCSALETVTVADFAEIGAGAFQSCESLKSVTLGSNVVVGKMAFQGCDALRNVTVGNGAKCGKKAFANCPAVRSATVGTGLECDGPLALPASQQSPSSSSSMTKRCPQCQKLRGAVSSMGDEVELLKEQLAKALEAAHRTTLATDDSALVLKCPITMQVMTDPVTCPSGHTFEKAAIQKWLKSSKTNPLTREPLFPHDLFPNKALKKRAEELRAAFAEFTVAEDGHFFCGFTGRHLHFVNVKGYREWWVSDFRQNKRHG